MQKHQNLIDEVFCQLIKQLTENPTDRTHCGWKLMLILLNYFLPSEQLRRCFSTFLQQQENEKDRRLSSSKFDGKTKRKLIFALKIFSWTFDRTFPQNFDFRRQKILSGSNGNRFVNFGKICLVFFSQLECSVRRKFRRESETVNSSWFRLTFSGQERQSRKSLWKKKNVTIWRFSRRFC